MAKGLRAASKLSKLDALGSSKGDFDIAEGNDVIKNAAGAFIQRVQANLKREDKWLTGKTANLSIVEHEDGKGLDIVANRSLEYLDKGVSGTEVKYNTPYAYTNKMPPVSVFIDWIKRKNLNLVNNEKYKGDASPTKDLTEDEQIKGAAFGMAVNKKKKGQKPLNVYSSELNQLADDVAKAYADYVVKAIFDKI